MMILLLFFFFFDIEQYAFFHDIEKERNSLEYGKNKQKF